MPAHRGAGFASEHEEGKVEVFVEFGQVVDVADLARRGGLEVPALLGLLFGRECGCGRWRNGLVFGVVEVAADECGE